MDFLRFMPTVLLVRTDADGASFWNTYGEMGELLDAIAAHANTVGVSRLEIIFPQDSQTPQETLAAVRDKEPARYAKARDMYELRKRQTGSVREWENLTFQTQLNWIEMAARFTEQEG